MGIVWFSLMGACGDARPDQPIAQSGVLDLRHWNFERDGPVELKGEWFFWWKELVAPKDFLEGLLPPTEHGFFEIPNVWTGQPNPHDIDTQLEGTGYATFALKLVLPEGTRDRELGVSLDHVSAAYSLSVTGRSKAQVIMKNGRPSSTPELEIPNRREKSRDLLLDATTHPTLVWHISNAYHSRGGAFASIYLGTTESMRTSLLLKRVRDAALLGIFIIMSLYHFLLFSQRRTDRASLWFGIFTGCMAIRHASTSQLLELPLTHPNPTSFEWIFTAEYLGYYWCIATFFQFFFELFTPEHFRTLGKVIWVIVLGFTALTLVTPVLTYSAYLHPFHAFTLVSAGLTIYLLASLSLQGNYTARACFLGFIPVVIAISWDILTNLLSISSPTFAPYGVGIFILAQSYILATRFSRAYQTAEILTHQLESEVKRQTNALMQNNEQLLKAYEDLQLTSQRELRNTKNILIQNEKLSQLGQLIASIGHEISTPVMLASMSVDNQRAALDKLEDKTMKLFAGNEQAAQIAKIFQKHFDDIREINQSAKTATSRIRELSTALRTQARKEDGITEGINLNEVAREAMALVAGRIKPHIMTNSLGELPPISCYRSRVSQIMTNLLANAADALHDKVAREHKDGDRSFRGTIHIASLPKAQREVEGVLVSVSDNGDGIPERIRSQIFDEFFTTKPAGVGTGLGLAMCVGIVKDHGGTLNVTNDPTLGGARFELWLPNDIPEHLRALAPEPAIIES